MTFSSKLLRMMARRGLTQESLGHEMGVSHVAVGNWLRGARPRASTAARLADYFGVLVEDLMDDSRELPGVVSPEVREVAAEEPLGARAPIGTPALLLGRGMISDLSPDAGSAPAPASTPADQLIAAAAALGTLGAKAKFATLTVDAAAALGAHLDTAAAAVRALTPAADAPASKDRRRR